MASKTVPWTRWGKMLFGGALIAIGGPALVVYVTPTEQELFQKYNPDLQKKSRESRIERQQDFDDFVGKLKEYSKSDKPIWVVSAEADKKGKEAKQKATFQAALEAKARKEQLRAEAGLPPELSR